MISFSDKTAVLLDASTGSAHLVEFDGELDTLRKLLPDIELFDTIRLDSENIIFVDDEGLLKPMPQNGFLVTYKGRKPIEIVGSALITGDDGMGGNRAVTFDPSDIQIVKVGFYGKEKEEKAV